MEGGGHDERRGDLENQYYSCPPLLLLPVRLQDRPKYRPLRRLAGRVRPLNLGDRLRQRYQPESERVLERDGGSGGKPGGRGRVGGSLIPGLLNLIIH